MTTIIVNLGWLAGRKPTYEAQTSSVYCPLTGICDVPVFPAWSSSKPLTREVQPEPCWTTSSIIAATAQQMTAMMEDVVQHGSGWTSRVKGFELDQAGKTGTSQIPVNGQY